MATNAGRWLVSGCWILLMMLALTACGQFQARYPAASQQNNRDATERGGGEGGGEGGGNM